MQAFLGRLVGAKVLQHVIDGIFKTGPGLVRSFHAFRHKLANFKSVHPLRQGAVYLIGTHITNSSIKRWLQRGVLSSSEALGRPEPSRLVSIQMRVSLHCTLESALGPQLNCSERRISCGFHAFVEAESLLSYKSYRPEMRVYSKRLQ